MKKTKEIIGLHIISIDSGNEVGHVQDIVLNPETGTMDFIIVDQLNKYFGAKVISFREVLGIGEFAVTIARPDVVTEVAANAAVQELLKKDVRVIGTKVLTSKGHILGEVQELIIDDNTGKITACIYMDKNQKSVEVAKERIITFGKELLIVKEPLETVVDNRRTATRVENEKPIEKTIEKSTEISIQKPTEDAGNSEAVSEETSSFNTFELRQLEYLEGKSVNRDITLDNGDLLTAGDTITPEIVAKITSKTKLMEISSYINKS